MTQTLSSALRLRPSLELGMASTSIRFLSALPLHSRSQGGWSQSQLSRVTAGNNLDESPSHRRATSLRQTATADMLTARCAFILGCGRRLRRVEKYHGIRNQTHNRLVVWKPACYSDGLKSAFQIMEKTLSMHENVSDFRLSNCAGSRDIFKSTSLFCY